MISYINIKKCFCHHEYIEVVIDLPTVKTYNIGLKICLKCNSIKYLSKNKKVKMLKEQQPGSIPLNEIYVDPKTDKIFKWNGREWTYLTKARHGAGKLMWN